MRLFMDLVILMMVSCTLLGVIWHVRNDRAHQIARDSVREEVRRFQQEIAFQATVAKVDLNERGFPITVDPAWFQGQAPVNRLLGESFPWVEVAPVEQQNYEHPVRRVAMSRDIARYWYNPYNGTVRARVPAGVSDAEALELYNYVNGCNLPTLFADASGG